MQNKFKSFYQPNIQDDNVIDIIKSDNVLFIFDTNILLNLYRYKEKTREDFFSILDKVNNKTFIPHHVALEYQKNRLNVIAEQNRDLKKLLKYIEDGKFTFEKFFQLSNGDINQTYQKIIKKHPEISNSIIQMEKEISPSCENLRDQLITKIKKIIDANIKINSDDNIRNKLDSCKLTVGEPFDQDKLDEIFYQGLERFEDKIAPGYGDEKSKNNVVFSYAGNRYEQKYGDLIIWEQIKVYLKNQNKYEHIIFVTDDQEKNDWVEKVKDEGTKIVGPKVELISELIKLNDKIKHFLIFDSINFLQLSSKAFSVTVKTTSVDDIKEIKEIKEIKDNKKYNLNEKNKEIWQNQLLPMEKNVNTKIYMTDMVELLIYKREIEEEIDKLNITHSELLKIYKRNSLDKSDQVKIKEEIIENEIKQTVLKIQLEKTKKLLEKHYDIMETT